MTRLDLVRRVFDYLLGRLEVLWTSTPDLVVLVALGSLAAAWVLLRGGRAALRSIAGVDPPSDRQHRFPYAFLLFCWILIYANFVPVVLTPYYLPRYLVVLVPLLVATGVLMAREGFGLRRIVPLLLSGLVAAQIANRGGALYPPLVPPSPTDPFRYFQTAERSRECLAILRRERDAVRFVAENFPKAIVLTHRPFGHDLALTDMGFVDHPMTGYCLDLDTDTIDNFCNLVDFAKLEELNRLLLEGRELVVLAYRQEIADVPELARYGGGATAAIFFPREGDEVVKRIEGPPPLLVVRKDPANVPALFEAIRAASGARP